VGKWGPCKQGRARRRAPEAQLTPPGASWHLNANELHFQLQLSTRLNEAVLMQLSRLDNFWRIGAGLALFSVAAPACSDEDSTTGSRQRGQERDGDEASEEPIYAIESLLFGDQGSVSYVALLPTLDRSETVKLEDAREFAEYSPANAYAGDVIVASGESPTLTSYAISRDREWREGETLSFSSFTTEPLETNIAIDDDKAYVPFEGTNFVKWNPAKFEIEGEIGAPDEIPLMRREGDIDLKLSRGYTSSLRDDTLFQAYYWADKEFHQYTELSQISVIDTKRDRVSKVLDAPCPHLHIASQDDDGNLYLSNGQGSIAAAALNEAHPRNCFVKIPAGETEIDESSITHFADLTDGREGSNFFYVGDGIALFNVYHHERDDLGDDPEFMKVDYSENYHLWTYDLKTKEVKMMDGIGFSGGQFVAVPIDDRVFLTIPAADYSNTEVYEVTPHGGAKKLFDVDGWAFKLFRVR